MTRPPALLLLGACLCFPAAVPADDPAAGGASAGRGPEFPVKAEAVREDAEAPVSVRPLRRKAGGISPVRALPHEPRSGALSGYGEALTQRYIRQYSSPGGIAWLNAVIRRGEIYIPFIRGEIERRDLPPELLFLPVIESSYTPSAVSRSGARGLWQFMKNSMSPFDMKINDWMDERMDFWKSTEGGLRKLEENYRFFGDWALALAAYNTGLGGLRRVMERTGIRDYWVLSARKELRTETIHYVPKLLAVSHILSNPRRFGIDLWPENQHWTRIPAGRMVDLNMLAAEAETDGELLRSGNRELLYNISPPDGDYRIKVPARDAAALTAVLAKKETGLLKYYFHVIHSGDTLSALSRHYGVSVDLIQDANPGIRPRFLKPGQRIMIPAFRETGPYQRNRDAGDISFTGNYLVKKGETLWAIALAYNVDPEILADANGMDLNDTLREGRSLKVPIR
jgi:membrane-bound lytic murein transglycosylase D